MSPVLVMYQPMRNLIRLLHGLLVLGVVVLTGCTSPAVQTPAYIGTWHVADQKDPTVLSFTEETFTFTVGDGTSVLESITEPEEGVEPAPITKLTVAGSLMVTDETMFTLAVPEDGVSAEFVEGSEDANADLAISFLTVIFQGLSEQPMMVEIDATGEVMTIRGSFLALLTGNPRTALTACKSQPC